MATGGAVRTTLKWAVLVLLALLAVLAFILAGLWMAAGARECDEGIPAYSTLVPTPLGTVAVELAGPPDGPAMMLVHGTAGWSGFWRNVTGHLGREGWRVIAVDLPPFGYSERDPRARYDRTAQAARLAAVLADAAPRGAVVVGDSFGAGPATELALRAPERVRTLVLVDAALGALDPEPGTRPLGQRVLGQSWLAEPVTAATMANPMATGALLRSIIAGLVRARSFARLPGVGHIPHIEDEEGFLAALDAAAAPERGANR